MNITVVGAGHAGLVSAAGMAAAGHRVRVLDVDRARIERLRSGEVPFYEPGLAELVAEARASEAISFHDDAAEAVGDSALIFLCVGTPNGHDGEPDLRALMEAARTVADLAGRGALVVNRSTAPVGTAQRLREVVAERRGDALGVASNPEFLAEGSAVADILRPDRVIVGVWDDEAAQRLREAYAPILRPDEDSPVFRHVDVIGEPAPVPFLVTDPNSAELAKYAANAFLAVKISFINEIAQIAEEVGADITRVSVALGLDPRIGARFLRAGVGWGGSCLPKDILALVGTAETRGLPARMLRAASDVNSEQHGWVLRKLEERLKSLSGRRVGLLGLAFKPNTDDLRHAPALEIATLLKQRGARVRAFDPLVKRLPKRLEAVVELAEDPKALAFGLDALVLVTEWPEFADMDLASLAEVMRRPLLLDGRNAFDPALARAAGFTYLAVGLGHPQAPAESPAAGRELEAVAGALGGADGRPAPDLAAAPDNGKGRKPAVAEANGDQAGSTDGRAVQVPARMLGDLRKPLASILDLTQRMGGSEALSSAARELLARLGTKAESLDRLLASVRVTEDPVVSVSEAPAAEQAASAEEAASAKKDLPGKREGRPKRKATAPEQKTAAETRPAPEPQAVKSIEVPEPATIAEPAKSDLPVRPAASAKAVGGRAVETDVTELVQHVVGEVAAGPQVEFVVDPASAVVDPGPLRSAVAALLRNALERSDPTLPIVIGVSRTEQGVFVAVQDRNPEPPAELAATGQRTPAGELPSGADGTGIPAVDVFVRRTGGHAWVEAEVGRGATYWLFVRDPDDTTASHAVASDRLARASAGSTD